MLEFAWPWMFALLPLPLLVWWWLPPFRARQASVQIPFFERLANATGQTPQRGAVVLQRRATQMIAAVIIWLLIVVAFLLRVTRQGARRMVLLAAIAPFVLVVRKGNPLRIRDFSDLARPGVRVIHPDPLTSRPSGWARPTGDG